MATGNLTTDQPKNYLSIFLLGKPESGKSRTGNSILGKPSAFKFGMPTDKCSVQTMENRFGKNIHVIDTAADPLKENEIKEKMNQFKESSTSIYIFCIRIGRFNDADFLAYKTYETILDRCIFNSVVVLFTHFDKWENDMKDSKIEKYNFENYIRSLSQQNKTLLKLCGNRWVAFNNRLEGEDNDSQVKNLFKKIEDIMKPSKSWFSTIMNIFAAFPILGRRRVADSPDCRSISPTTEAVQPTLKPDKGGKIQNTNENSGLTIKNKKCRNTGRSPLPGK